jgi:hypothetical protein
MITFFALAVFAVFQAILLVATTALLVHAHKRAQRFERAQRAGIAALQDPLRKLLMREDEGQSFVAAFRRFPRDVATSLLLRMSGHRLGEQDRLILAPALRREPWIEEVVRQASSNRWWDRMDAARVLAIVGGPQDRECIERLLLDPHPAVASAATVLVKPHADKELIRLVIRRMPLVPSSVRQQQMRALRTHAGEATEVLVPQLGAEASEVVRRIQVQLAETLGTPAALFAVLPFAFHPAASVRAAVARALRNCFSADAVSLSLQLLRDDDWTVRAAAARALGALRARGAVRDLERALRDENWWVRFRAALALRAMGRSGFRTLQNAQRSRDRFARDMAEVALGLSEGSRLELSA